MKRYMKKHWRKFTAGFFASLMIFQSMSGAMEVVAYELGKVRLSPSTGEFYHKNLNPNSIIRNEETKDNTELPILEKEPSIDVLDEDYDESLEVISKRTGNAKTYRLADGSYVQETYFEPIHKKVGNKFIEIDNTLENVSKYRNMPIYENKDGRYTFKAQEQSMSMENEDGASLRIVNEQANLTTYRVKENIILYSEAYQNIDMEYRLGGNAVGVNFFINGKTDVNDISFVIEKGNLQLQEVNDALLFLDEKDQVVFSYVKPTIRDAQGEVHGVSFAYQEIDGNVKVTVSMEEDWINAFERSYPLTLSTRVADENTEINVDTSYNREKNPNQNSNYYQLFVGNEDGSLSGGIPFGISRTYVHVSGMNLGADKEILGAKLKLYKVISEPRQWNTIAIGKSSGYVKPSEATWNNKPAVTNISTTVVRADTGWQEFDVKSYIEDIYHGKNNTIELKATDESDRNTPNIFSSESGTGMPKISVTYKDAFDVNPNLPIDTFDTEMRIFSIFDQGFEAFSFDGIARPDTDVIFDLVERGKDVVLKSETSKGKVNKYFIDPIYITNHIANTQNYPKGDVNYTTDYINKDDILKFDTPYEYKVRVNSGSISSSKEFRTDSFIKYKVKIGDNLKNIASYYGVTIEELKADNNLTTNIVKEDDILLVRFKKNNDKVSKDVYTPPVRTVEYKAKYVNRGPRCSGGTCEIIDPVNAATGNYFYEGIDFTMKDAEDFNFTRYYNSTGPQLSNMFGNGFTTPMESYISYDKEGNLLYFTGDGKIFEFDKTNDGFQAKTSDKMEVTRVNEAVSIKDLDTEIIYRFDVYGYVDTMTSKEGIQTKINYDNYGLITSILVGEKNITFTYDENKLVKAITLPSGKQVSYEYDDKRNLIKFIDTRGDHKKYTYDKQNYLTSITDKNAHVVTQNTYDKEGRVTKQIDGNGNASKIVYGDHKTTITKSNGREEVYTYNDAYDIVSIIQDGKTTSKNTYDAYRNITSITNADGEVSKFTYDKQNLLKAEYPDGTHEEYRYDAQDNIIYQKDRDGNITETTYVGNDVKSTKDLKNNGTVYEYDEKRRVIQESDQFEVSKSYTYIGNMVASITHSNSLIEYFEYDANGNTIKESDNQGNITTYLYNANNEMIQKNYVDGTKEQWSYDANGNIDTYQDRIGGMSKNTYDKNNNLRTTTKGNITTTSQYNEMNQLIKETNEQGLNSEYTYDALGNKASETNAYGNTTTFEYDCEGNITKTTDSFGNREINEYKDGNLVKNTSKDGQITTFEYDDLKREIKKVNPDGTIETKVYEGLLLKSEIDGKGTIIEYAYDAFGRNVKTTTTYLDGLVSISETQYDPYGNVVETKEDGLTTKNTYDVYQRLSSTMDPLGNIVKKEYDHDGNVIKEIDALGNVNTSVYDGNQNILSTIDKNGNIETKTYNTLGQLISEKDALGYVKTYTYNHKGQVIKTIDPYKKAIEYTYDKYGNQIETKLEGKIIEKKTFDRYGRQIYNETSEEITTSNYDDFDRVIEKKNELTGLTTYTSYDVFGNIIEEKDSEGLRTTYEYDNFHRKIKAVDVYGRKEKTTYDLRDHVINIKNFDGTSTSSTYDKFGNVIESKDAFGKITKNTYNELHQVIRSDVGDKHTENIYDANGQVIEIKNLNNGTSTKSVYDKQGNVIESIDALGNCTKSEFDALQQVIATIDALGNKTTKEYDAYGNVIKEIDALGNTKQTKFNMFGLKEREVDERGFDTTYEYNEDLLLSKVIDAKGNTLEAEYNEKRQVIKEINANGGVTLHEYDVYGKEVKSIAPNGKETTIEFDSLGNVIKEVNGKKITQHEYDKRGRFIQTSINDVVQVKNEYNKKNQIVKSFDANGNVSTFKYDINNQVIYANEKGSITKKRYDVDGNIIKQIDNKTYITQHRYDATNRLIETNVNGTTTLQKEYDSNGNEMKSIEHGVEVRKSYNEVNKVITIEVPSASKENEFVVIQQYEYDESGNPIKTTDANGAIEEKKYDAFHNVTEEINKNGIATLYEYDGLHNVIKVQNHEDRYVSYTYDESNNVTYKKINDKLAENRYDEDNNLIYEKNENGYVSQYEYDVWGRRTKETKPDKTSIAYTYDKLGNKLSENDKTFTYDRRNNVLSSSNQEGAIKNTYDLFNHKTSTIDTKGNRVVYVFNTDQTLSQKQYAGIEVNYSYNEQGQIDTIKKGNQTIAQYEYNKRNEIVKLTQENTITQKSYDDMGRVLSQKSSKNGILIMDASYTYDDNDNLVKEIVDGKENTYEYDAYDELSKSYKYVDGKRIKTTYQQDVFGNQIEASTSKGKKISKYNDRNQVESIQSDQGTIKFEYDGNGNISKKVNEDGRVDTYTYDEFNQLIQLDQDQYVYDYTYDAENERIQEVRTDTKDYHYDQWYNYREPLDVVSDVEIDNTFTNLKEQAKKKQANGNTCTLIKNDFYDVEYYKEPEVTDYIIDRNMEYSSVLVSKDTIHVYGDTLLRSGEEDIVSGWNDSIVAKVSQSDTKKISYRDYGETNDMKKGHGYNGEMLDQTGLIYLRARYYDPSVSRFIQIDRNYDGEKEHVASQNKYVYTLNNPYKYVDKDGNKSLFGVIGDSINKIVKSAKKAAKNIVNAVTNFFNPVANKTNKIVSNISKISDWVVSVYDGVAGNTTSKNGGGSISKKPIFKVVNAIANCPTKEFGETKDDIFKVIEACMNWPTLIENTYKLFKNGFKMTGWLDFILACIGDGEVNGVRLSANGARDIVKKITGLGTGGRTKIGTILKRVFLNGLKINRLGEIGRVIKWNKVDVFSFAVDVILNLTKPFRILAIVIAEATYKFIKKATVALIRAVLTPFMGPFAWLLGTVLEIGVDIIDFFIDLKGKLTDFTEWLVKQVLSIVESFIKAVLN